MITDLNDHCSATIREADVCIIGAGTAGLTLVGELLPARLKIVVLESGGHEVEERTQKLYDCELVGLPHRGHIEGRFRVLGGTSTRWGGQLLPLTPHDIEERNWIGAEAWPVKYADLVPHYRRVEKMFEVDEQPYDLSMPNALPVELPRFDTAVFSARYAKWPSFARRNLAVLMRETYTGSDQVEIILHANVNTLASGASAGHIGEVQAKSFSGATVRVRAKYVVVSMGTLETIRLLLNSGKAAEQGIGNHSGWLGRNFQDHLSMRAAELTPDCPEQFERSFAPFFIGSTMRTARLELSPKVQRERSLLSCFGQVLFETPDDSGFVELREALRRLQRGRNPLPGRAGWLHVLRDLPYMCRLGYSRYVKRRVAYPDNARFYLQVDVEQQPNHESRVTLSDRRDEFGMPVMRLDWRVGEAEKQTLQQYVSMFRQEWERLRLGGGRWNESILGDGNGWLKDAVDVFHQTGGTRMSVDPDHGVVDSSLRVHGTRNLFVASCSVFPTAGSANPTFTLLALTVRLADHIRASV